MSPSSVPAAFAAENSSSNFSITAPGNVDPGQPASSDALFADGVWPNIRLAKIRRHENRWEDWMRVMLSCRLAESSLLSFLQVNNPYLRTSRVLHEFISSLPLPGCVLSSQLGFQELSGGSMRKLVDENHIVRQLPLGKLPAQKFA